MIHYYYGNGKGKTSAAAGACIRALGSGMKCAFVQFHKNGTSSEITVLRQLQTDVFTCTGSIRFFRDMTAQEITAVTKMHNENLQRVLQKTYDLIVLDELGDALLRETVDAATVLALLKAPPCELIITGHKPDPLLTEYADYITEFRCIAHPYRSGCSARRGIEY